MRRGVCLLLSAALCVLLSACSLLTFVPADKDSGPLDIKDISQHNADKPSPSPDVPETPAPTQVPEIFAQLEGVDFFFASGAGGWSTQLHINSDGSFAGSYHDGNMGEFGPDYPNGTIYICEFSGTFSQAEQINDWTYALTLGPVELADEPGTSWIQDDVKYIASEPYGLDGAQELLLYLPGAPTEELPGAFLEWISMPRAWSSDDIPAELPFWGLYNAAGEQGFSGE